MEIHILRLTISVTIYLQEDESALLLFIPFSLYEKVRAANAIF